MILDPSLWRSGGRYMMCIKYMYRVAKLRVELAYQHKLRYTRAFLPSPAIVSGMSQEMSKNDKMTWGISHNMSIIHLCIHACVYKTRCYEEAFNFEPAKAYYETTRAKRLNVEPEPKNRKTNIFTPRLCGGKTDA